MAMVDTARPASLASRPKMRRAAPVRAAAEPRSVSTALANLRTSGVMAIISVRMKPSLANSICREVTSEAEKEVAAPSSRAWFVRSPIELAVVPRMAASLELAASKSEMMEKTLEKVEVKADVTLRVIDWPTPIKNPRPISLKPSFIFCPHPFSPSRARR